MNHAHFATVHTLSGDNYPIDYDTWSCQTHGLEVLSFTAAGAGEFPHEVSNSLKAFLSQSSRFLAPVYPGDTLYRAFGVADIEPQHSIGVLTMETKIHNQDRICVPEGTPRYLQRKRPIA